MSDIELSRQPGWNIQGEKQDDTGVNCGQRWIRQMEPCIDQAQHATAARSKTDEPG